MVKPVAKKKLIYILNRYSKDESSHYHHVIGLLEALGARGIFIMLIIEKADSLPMFACQNIDVISLKNRSSMLRYMELFGVIARLIRLGYTRTFVRIAAPAALTATVAHHLFGGSVFFWQSGTTLEYDLEQPLTFRKIKWYLTSHLPSTIARRFAHYFVTGPEFMVEYYCRVADVRREKIRLLYNDIDVARFAPGLRRTTQKGNFLSEHGFDADTLLILLVHRLSPVRKTVLYVPHCLTYLRDRKLLDQVVLVVAGDGPELPVVREQAANEGVSHRCVFLGSVPNREIERLYGIADIFAHPTYNEGFPRVILEAMAAMLPIVSTDAGGTRELLGVEQQRFVVSRDAPDAFAAGLEDVIRDPALREQLAQENLSQVQRFTTERVAEMYDGVLFS